ncbi:conserved exported hypothetical protein [Candidatus Sulfopaludibacter sp. SbA6]|nr:conserved exported hypothetical protein [Candidatus Sulfopaludibacter sp. SbA6]
MRFGPTQARRLRRCALVFSIAAILPLAPRAVDAQRGGASPPPPPEQEEVRLPNGKLQRDEIAKAEHEQNLKDAAQLVELSEQLKEELEKNDRFVVSMSTVKKTDDIEKLVRKIRSRLRHN